jgi:hypothetical protein
MRNYSELFLQDLSSLFRTSLIITGSTESAECALIEAISGIRKFEPPANVFTREPMEFAVARNSVGVLHLAKFASGSAAESASHLVFEELRPPIAFTSGFSLLFRAPYVNR